MFSMLARCASGSVNLNINLNANNITPPPPPPPHHYHHHPAPGKHLCDLLLHHHTDISLDPRPIHDVRSSTDEFLRFIQDRLPTPLDHRYETDLRNLLDDYCEDVKIMWTSRSTPRDLRQELMRARAAMPVSISAQAPVTLPDCNVGAVMRALAPFPEVASVLEDRKSGEIMPGTAPAPAPCPTSFFKAVAYNNTPRKSTKSTGLFYRVYGSRSTSVLITHDQMGLPAHLRTPIVVGSAHQVYGDCRVTKPRHKTASFEHRTGKRRSNYGPPQGLDQSFWFPDTHPEFPGTYPYDTKSQRQHQNRLKFQETSDTELDVDSVMPTPKSTGRVSTTRNKSTYKSDGRKTGRSRERLDHEKSAKYLCKERRRHKEQFRLDSDTEDEILVAQYAPSIEPKHSINETSIKVVLANGGEQKLGFETGERETDSGGGQTGIRKNGSTTVCNTSRAATRSLTLAPTHNPDIGGIYATAMLTSMERTAPKPSRNPAFTPGKTSAEAMANFMRAREAAIFWKKKADQEFQSSVHEKPSTIDVPRVSTRTGIQVDVPVFKVDLDTENDNPVVKVKSETELDILVTNEESSTEVEESVVKIEPSTPSSDNFTPNNLASAQDGRPSSSGTMSSGTMASDTVISPLPLAKKRARDDTDDVEVKSRDARRPMKKARLSRAI
jgi:hypothetical protein